MNYIIPTNHVSAVKERAIRKLSDMTGNSKAANDFLISRQTLRVVKALANSQNSYEFDIHSNNTSTDGVFEKRLRTNDLFFAAGVSIKVARHDGTNWNSVAPLTYPDDAIFTGGSGAEAISLLNLWVGGHLSFKTANLVRFEDYDMQHCFVVPERALAAVTDHAQFGPSNFARGFAPIEPNLVVSGKESNVFTLDLGPGAIANLEPAAGTNYVVLEIDGMVVANAAQQVDRWINQQSNAAAALNF